MKKTFSDIVFVGGCLLQSPLLTLSHFDGSETSFLYKTSSQMNELSPITATLKIFLS